MTEPILQQRKLFQRQIQSNPLRRHDWVRAAECPLTIAGHRRDSEYTQDQLRQPWEGIPVTKMRINIEVILAADNDG